MTHSGRSIELAGNILQTYFMRFLTIITTLLISATAALAAPNPLLDWKSWQIYRGTVHHPTLGIKAADIERARANIQNNAWAKTYNDNLIKSVTNNMARLTPEFLESMIPETTPLGSEFTPCPACRDQGKPLIPHGLWTWHPDSKDQLTCSVCLTTFPNAKYPESTIFETKWGKPGTLTFCSGEPFTIFGRVVRPSFAGNIRARKVEWMSIFARQLAEAYALTGNAEYARTCRLVLLRFSVAYPNWLVHSGYGEFADMDPKLAGQAVNDLPEDEITCPPNRPDRKLPTGYWTAGRASGSGLEGIFVRRMAESYDLTCTAVDVAGGPLYSDAEMQQIERDLLLEGSALLVGDPAINNKSMANRTSAALAGMCTGNPDLVRFGMEGFQQTVNSWFLPDGGTPESPAYALMAINGIIDLPQAMRGYSDPPGYVDNEGRRYEKLDLYQDPAFSKIWRALYNSQQGDLRYPPLADSYLTSALGVRYAEIMAANYPADANYLAFRNEITGPNDTKIHAATAIYARDPAPARAPVPRLKLPDVLFADLRQGFMRSGPNGRDELLLLNASHWGVHHHLDSLNLYYWKSGQELLSDFGYLRDHPQHDKTVRSLAHNLVLIDEKDQQSKERGGEVEFFAADSHVKVMRAKSAAYPQTSIYQRTSALIDHGAAGSYTVDFFRVQGGKTQDYVFHGPNNSFQSNGLNLTPDSGPLYDLKNTQTGVAPNGASLTWKIGPQMEFDVWMPPLAGEHLSIGEGWGQRDSKNADIGATLPYIIRRTMGDEAKTFTAVFEGHVPGGALVKSVRTLAFPGTGDALAVETTLGTDIIVSSPGGTPLKLQVGNDSFKTSAPFTVVSLQNKKPIWSFAQGSALVRWNGVLQSTGPAS